MSEKPQEASGQEDLLEQIIAQGLERVTAPAQTAAAQKDAESEAPSAPNQEDGARAAPPADGKTRRNAVYLYLLVLFGAAFLMLLLAYFIQQRSSEDTISDLRDSMNLSRTELLAEIRRLEEENNALDVKNAKLQRDLTQWQARYEEITDELALVWNLYDEIQDELFSWELFWELERCYQAGNYEGCAVILISQLQGPYSYRIPNGAEQRYEEIVQAVIGAGILEEDYAQHPEDYGELMGDHSIPLEWWRWAADR